MVVKRFTQRAWLSGLVLSAVLGLAALVGSFQSFATVRAWADWLSKDGHMDMLTAGRFANMALALKLVGVCLLVLAIVLWVKRQWAVQVIAGMGQYPGRCWALLRCDGRSAWAAASAWRLERSDLWTLAGLTLLGALLRVVFLSQPMGHDESYTVVSFGFAPFYDTISNYHMPNNHVLHSVLVYLSYHLIGKEPWMVRLPAFLAGVLMIPASYALARALYDRYTALLCAALTATLPDLIYWSTIARGYSLLILLGLTALLLADSARRRKNSVVWALMALTCALGFFTIPIFLYPAGTVFLWLLVSALVGDIDPAYGGFWRFLRDEIVGGLLMLALTLLFYVPLFTNSGPGALLGNTYIEGLDWPIYWVTFQARMIDTWREWSMDVPGWGIALYLAGLALGLVFHRRIARHRIAILPLTALWLAAALMAQRPHPWSKLWTFLIPLTLMWSSAGLLGLIKEVRVKAAGRDLRLVNVLVSVVVVALTAGSLVRSSAYLTYLKGEPGEVQQVTLYFKDNLRQGDLVVVAPFDDAPLWYYFKLYDMPRSIRDRSKPFKRALVMVNAEFEQTLDTVIRDRGPDRALFDFSQARVIYQTRNIAVYEMIPIERALKKIYGDELP